MQLKQLLLIILILSALNIQAQKNYEFEVDKNLEATLIKNQAQTGTCWAFATASMVESEMLRLGVTDIDLAEMFVVRQIYVEKALNYVRRQGKAQFSQGSLSHDLMNVIKKYGIVPQSAYEGKYADEKAYNHGELEVVLKSMVDAYIKQKSLSPRWINAIEAVLDTYLGAVPETFTFNGKTYTPKTFAAEVVKINPKDYVEITSYTHHPFYEQFILEIPDNFSNGSYYNVPINELMAIVDNSIAEGYSVGWDTDVSEKTFSSSKGLAIMPEKAMGGASTADLKVFFSEPQKEVKVTQALRQSTFESYSTTDDHLMHITGTAKDKNGTTYYIVKNSWGNRGPFEGYIYTSSSYFQLKTVSVMVHKSIIPSEIAQKMGL